MSETKAANTEQQKEKHYILKIKDYIDLRFEIRRNSLTLEIEIRDLAKNIFTVLDEPTINSLWIDMQVDGYKVSENLLMKIINSKLVRSYNPIQEYFMSLPEWDGYDYIADLASTIEVENIQVGETNLTDLWRPYLQKWLVGNVATVLGRGVNHLCLILVGDQGVGKTTWLNNFCPEEMKEFLVCSHIVPSLTDQNTANYLAEKWFVNIDDQLETIFGKDFNSMKAIITAPDVTNRKTWHRFSKKRKRICSFMGSVNNHEFLTDSQNRRYLVFTAKDVNFKHDIPMVMVWTQAMHLLNQGHQYWFAKEEISQLNAINETYRQTTPEEEWLMKLFDPCEPTNPKAQFLMPSEILAKLNSWSGMRLSIKKLSMAMSRLSYGDKVSKRFKEGSRKVYCVTERTIRDEEEYQKRMKD